MSNKPQKVVLPKNGMEGAAKRETMFLANKEKQVEKTEPKASPPADVQSDGNPPANALQALQDGIAKYSSINEHGKGVWVVSDVKKRIDELNYRTGRKVSIRAFTNAALEFVLDNYGEKIIELFNNR